MTRKQGIRIAIFLVCIIVTVILLVRLFSVDNTVLESSRLEGFYMQPENSLDGVFIGRSMVDTDWAAPVAWQEKGITVYPVSSNDQPFCITLNLIKEIQKTQNPKLFIVDVHGIRKKALKDIRKGLLVHTSNMPLSMNKMELIRTASYWDKGHREFYEIDRGGTIATDLSYYWDFMNNHARWEMLLGKIEKRRTLTLASALLSAGENNNQKERFEDPIPSSESFLDEYATSLFLELLDFCEENEIPVLFIGLPTVEEEQEGYMQMNRALEMAEERNFSTLNLNTSEKYKEMGLDFEVDFRDNEHLNYHGAIKVTKYLTEYLAGEYGFTDKRGNADYAHWDESWELFTADYQKEWGSPLEH